MTFIDDNYLDGIITRMTAEHKATIMRTARRLNLPDDDVLFLYIGAVEYTVQLCEDILGGISTERHKIEQSSQSNHQVSNEQAKVLIEDLTRVGSAIVAEIKKSGMAATSAIADANSETLTQALRTATMASSLSNSTIGLIEKVAEDRKAHQLVMQEVVQQVNDAKAELNKAVERTKGMHGAMDKLQNKIRLSAAIGSIAPLTAIGVAMVAGGMIWAAIMHLYWGETEKYLPVIKNNQAQFDKCFEEDGSMKPGLECKILYQKINKGKK